MVVKIPKEFKKWDGQFKKELIIAFVILILPFLIYLHLVFSKNSSGIDILSIEWKHGFKNNQLFAWNLLSDLIPLCLLITTYMTIKNIYKHYITLFIVLFICFTVSDLYYLNPMFYVKRIEGLFFAVITIIGLMCADRYFINEFRKKSLAFSNKEVIRELIILNNSKIIKNVEKTAKQSGEVSTMQYVCRLHYYSELMQKAINKSIKNVNEDLTNSKLGPGHLIIQILLILALVLNFVYLIFPKDLRTIEFVGVYVDDLGFGTINNLAWYLFKKLSLLSVFTIWFFTSNNWWRIAILSPTIIYAYQLLEIFYDIKEIESYGNSNIFPAVFLISILVIIISRIIKLRTKMMDYLEMFQNEINKEIGKLSKSY